MITAHALMSLEARGTLFVSPGMEVILWYDLHNALFPLEITLTYFLPFIWWVKTYEGMIVGEHSRDTDLDVSGICSNNCDSLLLF